MPPWIVKHEITTPTRFANLATFDILSPPTSSLSVISLSCSFPRFGFRFPLESGDSPCDGRRRRETREVPQAAMEEARRPGGEAEGRQSFPAFPFEPYDVQKDLMRVVYRVLNKGGVGIVESPTGTGKTLSLLCSSLQWLVDRREGDAAEGTAKVGAEGDGSSGDDDDPDWIKDFEVEKRKSRLVKRVAAPKAAEARAREGQSASATAHWGGTANRAASTTLPQNPKADDDFEEEFLIDDEERNDPSDAGKRKLLLSLDDSDSETSDTEEERCHRQILYCSRTHSQLSQAIKELRGTALASQVSAAILGSRKGLCSNEKVTKLKSVSRINEQCIQLQQKKSKKKSKGEAADKGSSSGICAKSKCGCPYFQKRTRQEKLVRKILARPMDIEDIGAAAKSMETCGYYAARRAALDADIIFLPYNTVLSRTVRETSGVRVRDSIVIIDEAHNIADAVNNMHSVLLTSAQARAAKKQIQAYRDRFKSHFGPTNARNVQMLLRLMEALLRSFGGKEPGGDAGSSRPRGAPGGSGSARILSVNAFLSETGMDNINIFKLAEFVRETKLFFKVSGFSEALAAKAAAGGHGAGPEVEKLGSLNAVMDLLLALTNNEEDGRVILSAAEDGSGGIEQIKFVMLNAATHFESLVREAHAVVLAGGTLQPLDDLFLQVMPTLGRGDVQTLSCGHVINKDNLLTLTVPKGPAGSPFEFVHAKRGSEEMVMDLGRLVVNTAKVVPDGVVCFFPSYKYSDLVLDLWRKKGILDLIERKKRIFGEPKGADEVEGVLQKFKKQIESSEDDQRGAILFCVVGGKMSEGINFSDRLGRCVILAGLPYPNIYDRELNERLNYLDQISSSSSSSSKREHMENICMKAVNQTIGRAIRHRGDYACIVLADTRYCAPSGGPFRKLPDWIREGNVSHCGNFGQLYRSLVAFFQTRRG